MSHSPHTKVMSDSLDTGTSGGCRLAVLLELILYTCTRSFRVGAGESGAGAHGDNLVRVMENTTTVLTKSWLCTPAPGPARTRNERAQAYKASSHTWLRTDCNHYRHPEPVRPSPGRPSKKSGGVAGHMGGDGPPT